MDGAHAEEAACNKHAETLERDPRVLPATTHLHHLGYKQAADANEQHGVVGSEKLKRQAKQQLEPIPI